MMQFITIMKLESISNKQSAIIINKIKLIIRLIEYQMKYRSSVIK